MKRFIISVTIFALLLTGIVTVLILNSNSAPEIQSPTPVDTRYTQTKTSKYVIGQYDGKIAVFNQNGEVTKIYDVLISTLPEYDQVQLNMGVQVENEEKLRSLIEDYTS